jgi:probable phosphoglycerate mutase
MRIILTRHGETDYNVKGLIQGQQQSKLTRNGIKQAKALAQALKNEKIDIIYTGILDRVIKTAEIINKYHQLKINKSKELNERKFGIWEGKKGDDIQKKFHYHIQEDINYKPKRAESWKDVNKRAVSFVKKIIKKHKGKTVLIIGHKGPNRFILGYFLKKPIEYHDKIKQYPANISIIEIKENKVNISVNNIKHLKGIRIIKEKKFVV